MMTQSDKQTIGIGVIGGGYMGKLHSVAMQAVGAVFNTPLRPRMEMIAATTVTSAENYRSAFGFHHATDKWRDVVDNPKVEALIIASPQKTHREIVAAAAKRGLPIFCEKPMGETLADSQAIVTAAHDCGIINMVGFNYPFTPAAQYIRTLINKETIGDIHYVRAEHTEDFYADPNAPASWRTTGMGNGATGDLAPHIVNAMISILGSISAVNGNIDTVYPSRPNPHNPQQRDPVDNDDQGHVMCRFRESKAMGYLYYSRVALGRKMGYKYDIYGSRGSISYDCEDQNAVKLYLAEGDPAQRGYRHILTGPYHPDYAAFCQGPGHGTGYQDQIIIEARNFLHAIYTKKNSWPTFADGLVVKQVLDAVQISSREQRWVDVACSP